MNINLPNKMVKEATCVGGFAPVYMQVVLFTKQTSGHIHTLIYKTILNMLKLKAILKLI